MIKKISYIFVLFISLFMISIIVEAKDCEGKDGNIYAFNSQGEIEAIRGHVTYWELPYPSAMDMVEKETTSVNKNYQNTRDNKLHLQPKLIDPDVCPNKEEISYTVTKSNVYTVTVADSYYTRLKSSNGEKADPNKKDEIVCPAVNDMEYSLVFEDIIDGGYLKSVTDKDGNELAIYGRRTARWKLNSKDDCPLLQSEFTVKKHDSYNAYIITKSDSYIQRVETEDSFKEGCSEFFNHNDCVTNGKFSCVWVDRKSGKVLNDEGITTRVDAYCNVDNLQYVQCGNAFDIPVYAPRIISFVINLLKILTPIILVFTSAITLLKAITANKEDDMNKAKTTLVKRIGIAALIFFTITITQFVINKVADDGEPEELSSCFDCFINNKCEVNKYYKNNINGEYKCFYTDDVDGNKVFKGECH